MLPVFFSLFDEFLVDGVRCERGHLGTMRTRTTEAELSEEAEKDGGSGDGEILVPAERGRRYASRFLIFDQAISVLKH